MIGRADEASPLLGGAVDPARGCGDADREGSASSRRLKESRRESRRIGGRQQASPPTALLQRHWRLSAGVAGVLIIPMALAGLVAIFSAVKRQASPRSEQQMTTSSKSRERCEKENNLARTGQCYTRP